MERQDVLHEPLKEIVPKTLEEHICSSKFLTKAYKLAERAHKGQMRASNEPYIIHPLEATRIIYEEWGILDENLLAAELNHDTKEDTNVTLDDLAKKLNPTVASLVGGVSNLRSEKGIISKSQKSRENIKNVFKNALIDANVALLKIADRLHNMRTLQFMPRENQISKALETYSYVKMAESLGLWVVARELDNLSLKYSDPENFEKYSNLIKNDPRTDKYFVGWFTSILETIANESQINARVEYRLTSVPTLINKLGKYLPEKVNDLISFRIVIDENDDSKARDTVYKMLGILREKFSEIEDQKRFNDSYSKPTNTNYRATEITLETPEGSVAIAITSNKCEEFNNWGIVSLIRNGEKNLKDYSLKLFFTDTGEVKFFPPLATGLDFAYSISPEMGARAKSMSIDERRGLPISSVIPNGAEIKIEIDEPQTAPPEKFVNFCLPNTKTIIENQLSEQAKDKLEMEGKEKIYQIIINRGIIDLADLFKIGKHESKMKGMLLKLGCKGSLEKLYYKIGSGVMSINYFEKSLNEFGFTKDDLGLTSILIEGNDGPGIFSSISGQVARQSGNIGPMENIPVEVSGQNCFTLRLVVNGLNKKSEIRLAKSLQRDARITKVIVV